MWIHSTTLTTFMIQIKFTFCRLTVKKFTSLNCLRLLPLLLTVITECILSSIALARMGIILQSSFPCLVCTVVCIYTHLDLLHLTTGPAVQSSTDVTISTQSTFQSLCLLYITVGQIHSLWSQHPTSDPSHWPAEDNWHIIS